MSRLKERIENFNNSFKLFSQAQAAFSNDKESDINRLALTQAGMKKSIDTDGILFYAKEM